MRVLLLRSKPWTSQFLSVDDVTARQSRRSGNAVRYRDGTLRQDRPRPPPGSLPQPAPSPRQPWSRPDNLLDWHAAGAGASQFSETTSKAGYSPRAGITENLVVATRSGLSPRYMKSSIGDIVFGDTTNYAVREGYGPFGFGSAAAATAAAGAAPTPEYSAERRVAALEAAVRHEKRMADLARSRMITNLRAGIIVDPVGLHDPAAAP